jgi:anthranilate phosphoribosyltransferase
MPSTLKIGFCLTFVSAILIGSMFPRPQSAAAQAESHSQQTQRWVVQTMKDLDQISPTDPTRRAEYERCARRVHADYTDDPEQAYGWTRTLCRR